MAKKTGKIVGCEHCGKERYYKLGDYKNKLASGKPFLCRECYGANRALVRTEVSCSHCGKEKVVYLKKNENPNDRRFFCDVKCSGAYHSGSGNPMSGVEPWNKGKELPVWVKDIISNGNKKAFEDPEIHAKYCGENNTFWRGGIATTPYGPGFSRPLKRMIKERDCYYCRICGEKETECNKLHVHHIDYDKSNNDRSNLISLCNSCHSQSNFNRKFWKEHLAMLIGADVGCDFLWAFEENVSIVNGLINF